MIAVAGALAGLGGVAQADVLAQLDDFSITQVNPNKFVDNLTFNQFDPTVGTLQGIVISWSGSQQAFLEISSQTGGAWSLALNNEVQLSDADSSNLLINSLSNDLIGNLTPGGIPSQLEANFGIFAGQTPEFSTDDALFKGTGTAALTVTEGEVEASLLQSLPDLRTFGGTSDVADGTVELDYFYTPASVTPVGSKSVPEPASAVLLGTALLGLGITRGGRKGPRRRESRLAQFRLSRPEPILI